jgi:hypothetical protein
MAVRGWVPVAQQESSWSLSQTNTTSASTSRRSAPHNAFVFGVLHSREERALVETDDPFVHEWSKAWKKKRRRWLSP